MRKTGFILTIVLVVVGATWYLRDNRSNPKPEVSNPAGENTVVNEGGPEGNLHPLFIEFLRQREYPGSEMVIEQELTGGSNYKRYIASYKSEGLKIFGLLTIPQKEPPPNGWPAIVFNHGFIQPNQYVTTERYVEYVDGFARNEYVVFKPDYRGHGNSEGSADGNYYSPGYVVDVLNALASIKQLTDPSNVNSQKSIVNPGGIGMWGHSMGGNIALKSLVISDEIKAAVIWAGVVGSYDDIVSNWSRARKWKQSAEHKHQGPNRQNFLDEFGTPDNNPEFWSSIDPYTSIKDINTPVQLHHGTGDTHVPFSFSEHFKEVLEANNKPVELYSYEGADHNLSGSAFGKAIQRSVAFFNRYLK